MDKLFSFEWVKRALGDPGSGTEARQAPTEEKGKKDFGDFTNLLRSESYEHKPKVDPRFEPIDDY